MIFQPSGGAGSGGGLTVYNGYFSETGPKTFETPVKLVFVSYYYIGIPMWYILLPGEAETIYGILDKTRPPERMGTIMLSNDGKTLSCKGSDSYSFLYYAIG